MTLLPVIAREMRAAARQPFTYYSRAVGVMAFLAATVAFALDDPFHPDLSGRLFSTMNWGIFAAIWILVPGLTADCISRERREGTLGLLFMTGLKSSDIVIAKSFAHGLRALMLWLAVLPTVAIPFLMGGLTWGQCFISVLLNFSSICWALAAGLIASSFSTARVRALVGAVVLAAVFLLVFISSIGWQLLSPAVSYGRYGGWEPSLSNALLFGSRFILYWAMDWQGPARTLYSTQFSVVSVAGLFSVLSLVLAVLLAGARTRLAWQDKTPSPLRVWLHARFCTPILWRSFLRRWLRHKLERNPIGWLERRTWTGRVVSWGWLAVVVSLYSAVLTEGSFLELYVGLQRAAIWLMLGSVAFAAAGSFRRERETGVMELLLVSPVSERQLIWGRLRGLWGQFLPAFGLLAGIWAYFATFTRAVADLETTLFQAFSFLCLPVIGLYYSLRCRNSIVAFMATLAVGIAAAPLLLELLSWFCGVHDYAQRYRYWSPKSGGGSPLLDLIILHGSLVKALFEGLLAAWCAARLYKRLKHRNFPLGRQEA